MDLLRWLGRRPQLLTAIAAHEVALVTSARVAARLKALAGIKAAALINCEFCLDIGSAFSRAEGLTDAQLRALPSFRESEEFSDTEKLVLELAEAMTRTPTHVSDTSSRFARSVLHGAGGGAHRGDSVGEPPGSAQPGAGYPAVGVLGWRLLRRSRAMRPVIRGTRYGNGAGR